MPDLKEAHSSPARDVGRATRMHGRADSSRSAWRNWLLPVVLAFCFCQPLLEAQGTGVQVELTPNTIQLAAGDSANVLAIIRNDSPYAIEDLQIRYVSDLSLTVTPQTLASQVVKPGGVLAWPVEVKQSVPGRSVGALYFWLGYSTHSDKEGAIQGVTVATLQVQERPPLAIDKQVTLKLESAVDELDENRSARLYMVVTNMAAVPVTVKKIETYAPDFLRMMTPNLGNGVVLQPQTAQTFPVTVTITNTAVPGNHRVILAVDLSWVDAGQTRTGAVAVAQTLPVSILGESELLKLMGVPSFLFLPGFLALATFAALWTRVAPKKKILEPLSIEEKALLAVSVSFIAAFVYPWFANGRSYLSGYGLRDVISVWFGSILAATIAWILLSAFLAIRIRIRIAKANRIARQHEDEVRQKTPTKNDSPVQMLERMVLLGATLPPKQVMVNLGSAKAARAFQVLPEPDASEKFWVTPPVLMTRAGGTSTGWSREQLIAELQKEGVDKDPGKLEKVLSSAQNSGWTAEWGSSDFIVGPSPVGKESLGEAAQAQAFDFVSLGS